MQSQPSIVRVFATMLFLAATMPVDCQCLSAAAKEKTALEQEMDRSLVRYKVYEGKHKEPLTVLPVLSWNNPAAGTKEKCRTVLFLKDGQAKSACCIWTTSRRVYHEFSPISREPMRGELDGKQVWNFKKGALDFHELPDSEPAAASRRARLLQMKKSIRRFVAIELQSREGGATREQLRLLPTPLYRYEKESETILDGAVFCFVHTTDPEVLVVLECVRDGKDTRWEYAFVRRTTLPVEAQLDKKKVWSTEQVGYQAFTQIAYRAPKE